jgi:hypothetical protein
MLLTTSLLNVNPLAVLIAGLIHMVLGLVWFMPKIFGNAWVELTGKEMKPATQWIAAGIIGHLVMALVLAMIVNLANATTLVGGVIVGIVICLGFVAPLEVGELIWEKIPFKLFMIRVGNQLVGFSITGAILAVWR